MDLTSFFCHQLKMERRNQVTSRKDKMRWSKKHVKRSQHIREGRSRRGCHMRGQFSMQRSWWKLVRNQLVNEHGGEREPAKFWRTPPDCYRGQWVRFHRAAAGLNRLIRQSTLQGCFTWNYVWESVRPSKINWCNGISPLVFNKDKILLIVEA